MGFSCIQYNCSTFRAIYLNSWHDFMKYIVEITNANSYNLHIYKHYKFHDHQSIYRSESSKIVAI